MLPKTMMEKLSKDRTVGKVVAITAWLSFLASLWAWLFEILPWHAPVIMLFLALGVLAFYNTSNQ